MTGLPDALRQRHARWTHDGLLLSDITGDRYIVPRPARRMPKSATRIMDHAGWLWVRDGAVPEEAEKLETKIGG